MNMRYKRNPFIPDKPVTEFDLFAGRSKELGVLFYALYQIGQRNAKHMIVTGPRGIGKSSFINQIESLTRSRSSILRQLNIDAGEFGFRFAVIKHIAMKGESTEKIVTSLMNYMKMESKGVFEARIGSILEKWKPKFTIPVVGDIELQPQNTRDSSVLSTDFIDAVRNLWKAVRDTKDGIVIIVDEVDTVAEDTNIASFLKVLSELLVSSDLDRVALYLGGITDAMEKLKADHESIGRIFETVELNPMRPEESREVITKTLQSGVESSQVTVSERAMKQIIQIADGFPAIVHQLCFHAYRYDGDNRIDEEDLRKALVDVVTRVRRDELDKSLSRAGEGYARKILFAMANDNRLNVPLADIAAKLRKPSNEVSSPITKLVRDEKVVRIERGLYKIKDPLLRLYIRQLDEFEQTEQQEDEGQLPLDLDW